MDRLAVLTATTLTSAALTAVARVPPAWRVPVAAWLSSRLAILVTALIAGAVFGDPTRGVDPFVPEALRQLGGWDTTWYLDVARNGYETDVALAGEAYTNLAFFPLLPGIMAGLALLGLNPFVGALVVANLAFLMALVALRLLTVERFGAVAADRVTWVAALAPPSLYCSLAYTEGITVACAVGAALLALRRRWLLAGLLGGIAAVARPTGLLVAFLVLLLALREPAPGRWRRAVVALAPAALALTAFLGWMALARGSAFLPLEAQRAWDRGQIGIGLITDSPREIAAGWDLVRDGQVTAAWTATGRDVLFLMLYAWLLVRLGRREGARSPWFLYSLAALAIPLSSGTTSSMARFGVLAFPLVWPMADWLDRDPRRARWAAAVAVLVGVLMVAQLTIRSP